MIRKLLLRARSAQEVPEEVVEEEIAEDEEEIATEGLGDGSDKIFEGSFLDKP